MIKLISIFVGNFYIKHSHWRGQKVGILTKAIKSIGILFVAMIVLSVIVFITTGRNPPDQTNQATGLATATSESTSDCEKRMFESDYAQCKRLCEKDDSADNCRAYCMYAKSSLAEEGFREEVKAMEEACKQSQNS